MRFVLDASAFLAWVLAEQRGAELDTWFEGVDRRQHACVVPSLWHLEVGNVLLLRARRSSLPGVGMLADFVSIAQDLGASTDPSTSDAALGETLELAAKHRLTTYDASYLELAKRLGLPVLTLDAALAKASVAEGIPLLAGSRV